MPRTTKSATLSLIVGAQVKRRRRELGLSQVELAARLDVSATYVQNIERGCNVTLGQLERVAAALNAFPTVSLEPVAEELVPVPTQ